MRHEQQTLSNTFNKYFESAKTSGVLLIFCAALSLAITNSPIGGMAAPALIHYSLNLDTPAMTGFGILMATDILHKPVVLADLAFADNAEAISASETAILATSLMAGIVGFLWLQSLAKPPATDGHQ